MPPLASPSPSPSLSVVLPARDAAATLGAQLEALAGQNVAASWELIVVDDGSRDGTSGVLATWSPRLPGLQVVRHARPRGSNAARNAGAAVASGASLVFCDADDVVTDGWLAAHAEALARHDLVTGPVLVEACSTPAAVAAAPSVDWSRRPPVGNGFLPYGLTANLGVTRPLFDRIGGFDATRRHGADKAFAWDAAALGAEPHFAPGAAVRYRLRTGALATFRRQLAIGLAAPSLYRRFAPRGMPRSRARYAVRDLARLVADAPRLGDPAVRLRAARTAGRRLGRALGSLRHGVRYL